MTTTAESVIAKQIAGIEAIYAETAAHLGDRFAGKREKELLPLWRQACDEAIADTRSAVPALDAATLALVDASTPSSELISKRVAALLKAAH